jgi:hypothetical protein
VIVLVWAVASYTAWMARPTSLALAAEHVSLLEEHVGDLVAAGIDDEPLDLPDPAVGGMDVITAAHSHLSGGKSVIGGRGGPRAAC